MMGHQLLHLRRELADRKAEDEHRFNLLKADNRMMLRILRRLVQVPALRAAAAEEQLELEMATAAATDAATTDDTILVEVSETLARVSEILVNGSRDFC